MCHDLPVPTPPHYTDSLQGGADSFQQQQQPSAQADPDRQVQGAGGEAGLEDGATALSAEGASLKPKGWSLEDDDEDEGAGGGEDDDMGNEDAEEEDGLGEGLRPPPPLGGMGLG